jgi:hypothetical protein
MTSFTITVDDDDRDSVLSSTEWTATVSQTNTSDPDGAGEVIGSAFGATPAEAARAAPTTTPCA